MSECALIERWMMRAMAVACALITGCDMSRQAQLEAVAKDWCMTIRASQVIPVYPLTQDLQPGDVFLVQTTIDRQQELYSKKGFLPLDNHLARLQPDGYDSFYQRSFFVNSSETTVMPARWGYTNYGAVSGTPAPGAAFPTYSFSVRQGAGLNLAVPVSGVPIGLSLLGTQAANGSVSIKQARTMGVDTLSLFRDLSAWAITNNDLLLPYAPTSDSSKPRNFLRVVTRVYSTGQVSVALSDARTAAGGADVGVPRPVQLLTPRTPQDQPGVGGLTIEEYRKHLAALNAMLAESHEPTRQRKADGQTGSTRDDKGGGKPNTTPSGIAAAAAPGGSLRVTAASSRFVSMDETFDPPLIIGYLGFDVPILADGMIGAPVPTQIRIEKDLSGGLLDPQGLAVALYPDELPGNAYADLVERSRNGHQAATSAVNALNALGHAVPSTWTRYSIGGGPKELRSVVERKRNDKAGYENYEAFSSDQ